MTKYANPALNDGIFVVFGITGDLAKRKLLPALYHLVNMGLLSERFRIIGTTRRNTEIEEVIDGIRSALLASEDVVNESTIDKLRGMMAMAYMDIGKESDYQKLQAEINISCDEVGICQNRLFYLAVPPEMFEPIVKGLKAANLNHGCPHGTTESRLLIEKPFGYDTESAITLIQHLETVFKEEYIYRVDHYLAKETAQNILTFRLNNPIFRAVWSRQSIDHILITASEKIGIEGRANFYENTGALRDLIQSHLLQLLAITTMEEPAGRSAEAIHDAKLALLQAIQPIKANEVKTNTIRGQYSSYCQEAKNPLSITETYAAIKLQINNERWRDVPILMRTGKAMFEKITEITLVFKDRGHDSADRNMLTIRIQPDEGIVLSFLAKKPSLANETETVQMEFCYSDSFPGKQPDAYERVLTDAIKGDKTLFTTDDEVLTSWRIIEEVLKAWGIDGDSLEIYQDGSWGPKQADELAARSGAQWLTGKLGI